MLIMLLPYIQRTAMTLLRHLLSITLLPATVTLIIPIRIITTTGSIRPGWGLNFPWQILPMLLGSFLIAIGLFLLVNTIRMFAKIGRGTLAPWDPTRRLVVNGVYRYVRNPMISGVMFILLGEATLLGSRPLFNWFLLFLLINAIYIPLSEERGLQRRFGDDYRLYKANVPRWIPRLRPWEIDDRRAGQG
jgi:protein-S-isoprenylcysteine O-methyltransferase Ste14